MSSDVNQVLDGLLNGPSAIEARAQLRDDLRNSADKAELDKLISLSPLQRARELKPAAERLGVKVPDIKAALRERSERLEHSNGSGLSPTGTATSDGSNGCSNTPPVRTLDELYESAKGIAEAPDVLALVRDAIMRTGYAGDPNPVVLTYVALTSRLTDKPINLHVMAPSASGKNFTVNAALQLVPDEAVIRMTASTPKAVIYGADDLRHKMIMMGEQDSLQGLEGNAATLMRSIIEDGRTDFATVEKDPVSGRNVTRTIRKDGPTGLITTGVRDLEFQISTRMLNLYLSDDAEQTRAILKAQAALASGAAVAPDPEVIARFQDFQRWLAAQPSSLVVVPFADILAEKIPSDDVRMRRDFKQLLAVIKAIALLNQHHRARAGEGAIIAELSDYRWARELLLSVFRSIVGGGITDAIRDTCAAVPEDGTEVSEALLVQKLGLAKSTINYRVKRALKGGWIQNLEKRRGYSSRLVRGGPLPEDASPLPTVNELANLFEHPTHSNGYSNGAQAIAGVRRTEQAFECSNRSKALDANAIDDEDIDATREAEIDRLADADREGL